jgi:hypothetical protein
MGCFRLLGRELSRECGRERKGVSLLVGLGLVNGEFLPCVLSAESHNVLMLREGKGREREGEGCW